MKRKFLSILLTLAMALTLLPVSAMAEETPVEAPAETKVAKVGNDEYDTLQAAVNATTTENSTVTLLKDVTEDITIPTGVTVMLDLSGKTLTNKAGKHTITVENGGKLNISDSVGTGVVDNTSHGKGAIVNSGEVTLNGGTFKRSAEKGTYSPHVNGGNSWYTIANYGTMEINTGVTVENAGGYSSMIRNGGDATANCNLTIRGGNFAGGINTVKNDSFGVLTINGGNFSNTAQYVIMNWNKAEITAGTFQTLDTASAVLFTSAYGGDANTIGKLSISGGEFKHASDTQEMIVDHYDESNSGTAAVTGGRFDADISKYIPSDYVQSANGTVEKLGESNAVAKVGDTYYKTLADAVTAADNATVTLLKNVTANVTIPVSKTITLDLNGKTLSGGKDNDKAALLNNGTVTIKDSSATKTGTIKREDDADKTGTSYYVIKNLGTMTIEQANVNNNSGYKKTNSAGSMAGSSLICNGDREDDKETTLTINDGVFEQQNFLAVKNGAMGILNVNGGKFTSQHSAIQNWYKADIKGGEINGQLWTDAYTWEPNGVSAGETKISGTTKFTGEIVMDITGSVKPTLEISGGEMNVTNWRITSAAANAGAKPVITGGLFTSDPSAYVAADHHVDGSNNGDYPYIVKEGTKTDAPVIVKDATAVTVHDSEAINGLTESDKTNIANKSNVDGVAEAIADNKAALIPADVDTTDAKKVEIEVTVKVNVTGADMTSENKTMTFTAEPIATVTVTNADGTTKTKDDVKVDNSMLNGQPITVKLPLPAGFTPKQIKHISSDGSVEYFLKTAKRGANTFEIKDGCAVFTITKFSTFELSGTVTYVEPSSGSSSSDPTYAVSAPSKTENGSVTVSPKSASKGDTVTITVKPDSGYVLETLTVTDKNGNELTLKDKGSGKYTFTMPAGKVEVKATFMEDNSVLNFFYDVPNDAYFYEAVKWAVKNGITNGVGDNLFAPGQPCTRSQIVTFLWRAAGSPEPKGTAAGMTDVVSGSYYEKAVAWAIENGITTGTAEGTFSPDATCTRAQAVTFLARAQNAKATGKTAFSDVPADSYFADAVAWAQANGVTTGTSETTFSPDNDCTRAQIVTFLYRANQGT